ncbi:hypothetical protein OSJ57_09415 [Sphingomonas sp. HH69]
MTSQSHANADEKNIITFKLGHQVLAIDIIRPIEVNRAGIIPIPELILMSAAWPIYAAFLLRYCT